MSWCNVYYLSNVGFLFKFQSSGSSTAMEVLMTDDQKNYVKTMRTLFSTKPKKAAPRPQNAFQERILNLYQHSRVQIILKDSSLITHFWKMFDWKNRRFKQWLKKYEFSCKIWFIEKTQKLKKINYSILSLPP